MSPQTGRADTAPIRAPGPAARLVDGLRATVRAAGGTRRIVLPVTAAVVFTLAWEYATALTGISSLLVAPPSAVWQVLTTSFSILLQQAIPTVRETLLGFALAAVVGTLLGALLVLSRRVRQALFPHILMFQLIPKVALAPLFIIWLGVGPASRLSFAVFMAFFPVVVSTMTGLMSADRNIVRLCTALTASPWQIFCKVRVPYALPHLFTGLRVAVTLAIIGVIVGEFVTAQEGLGYIIMFATSAGDTALVFAAIVLVCALGLVVYGSVVLLEQLIQRRLGVSITTSEF